MKDRISHLRNEIACSVKRIRIACWGRKCLRACVKRMVAAAPCLRAPSGRGVAAAFVFLCLSAFAPLSTFADCSWDGSGCSCNCCGGGGGTVEVVTNFLGVCTNCVNMSPEHCNSVKSEILSAIDGILLIVPDVIGLAENSLHEIRAIRDEISTYRRFGPQTTTGVNATWTSFTNYIYDVENKQTLADRSYESNNSLNGKIQRIAFNDGIYDYAQRVKSDLATPEGFLQGCISGATEVSNRVSPLQASVSDLNCERCEPEYEPGGSPGGSGSESGDNWCTYEQGEALKELLEDTKDYVEEMKSSVEALSQTIQQGFFTVYDHIPTEEELGKTWQDLYLDGYSDRFPDYDRTNILARIELLLAGMSGVLTNNADFVEAGSFVEWGMASTNRINDTISNFTNEFASVIEQRETKVRSVGDSLIGLYNSFRGWSDTPFSRETLINSYSVEIGNNHLDVPSFSPSANGLPVANLIRLICRSIMSVIYFLFTVCIFIRFHLAFFQWVLKYLKWGIELMQGLFA